MGKNQRLARGKRLVAFAIAAMLGFSAFVIALTVRSGTFGLRQSVRLSLTILLVYMLWQGRPWARKLTVVLTAITAVVFGVLAVEQIAAADGSWVGVALSAAGACVYAFVAAVLGLSRDAKLFLERQHRRGV